MAVGYVFRNLGAEVHRNLPFLKYINPARACIIATWLLVMSFAIGELTCTDISRFLRARACIIATWLLVMSFVVWELVFTDISRF